MGGRIDREVEREMEGKGEEGCGMMEEGDSDGEGEGNRM